MDRVQIRKRTHHHNHTRIELVMMDISYQPNRSDYGGHTIGLEANGYIGGGRLTYQISHYHYAVQRRYDVIQILICYYYW